MFRKRRRRKFFDITTCSSPSALLFPSTHFYEGEKQRTALWKMNQEKSMSSSSINAMEAQSIYTVDETVYIQILDACRPFYYPTLVEAHSNQKLPARVEDSLTDRGRSQVSQVILRCRCSYSFVFYNMITFLLTFFSDCPGDTIANKKFDFTMICVFAFTYFPPYFWTVWKGSDTMLYLILSHYFKEPGKSWFGIVWWLN